jgi:hypothetical protein
MESLELIKNPTFWVIVAWVLREMYTARKSKDKELTSAIKEATEKIIALTISMTKLEVKLEAVEQINKYVPKMNDDLRVLHGNMKKIAPELYEPKI